MVEIKPVGASSKIALLVHGDIGTGKTTLAGTGGKKTLIMHPPTDHMDAIIGSGADEALVRNWEDIFEVLDYMRHEGDKYEWFWMDSISLLQDIGLDDVYQGVLDTKGPVGSDARAHRERFGPDRGEYRVNMWRLEQFVRHIVGAGMCNIGITAHSFWYTDPDAEEGAAQLMPWIQGKAMPQKICGMMNIVGYLKIREREVRGQKRTSRVMYTDKTETYYAKNQFKTRTGEGVFGDGGMIINPTIPGIMTAVAKARRPAATPARRRVKKGA